MLVIEALFLFGIEQNETNIFCGFTTAFLHCAFLCTISWVFFEGKANEHGQGGNCEQNYFKKKLLPPPKDIQYIVKLETVRMDLKLKIF